MGRARRLRWCRYIVLAALAITTPVPAMAGDGEEARTLFNDGSAQYQANHFDAALGLLERSYALVPSPNTKLLIARCHRELGHRVEAAQAFAEAEKTARRQVAQGESKYATTVDVAAKEGAKLRAELASIKVHVSRADTRTTVVVDGHNVALDGAGEAIVLHEPGSVTFDMRDASGQKQSQSLAVSSGGSYAVHFVAREPAPPTPSAPPSPTPTPAHESPPPPPPDRAPTESSWTGPAALVSGGVAVVGLGVFIGFGISSQNTYDNLAERCKTIRCGDSDRANADRGEREQTIANVGLVIAGVAAVATAVFVVMHSNASSSTARGGL